MLAWNLKQISHSRTTTGEKILTLSTPISMASCTQQCETLVTLPLDKGFSGSNLAEVVRLIKSLQQMSLQGHDFGNAAQHSTGGELNLKASDEDSVYGLSYSKLV